MFEYMGVWAALEDIAECCNDYSKQGWELVSMLPMKKINRVVLNGSGSEVSGAVLYLKRTKDVEDANLQSGVLSTGN